MVSKVTLSGYILNYVITPVSDYVVNCLLEAYQQSVILADLVRSLKTTWNRRIEHGRN